MKSEWHGATCPLCGEGVLADTEAVKKQHYRGKVYESVIRTSQCNVCGEGMSIFDEAEEAQWTSFRDEIDSYYAQAMHDWRKALDLSQKEAAEIVGGGVNAFSRYERGDAKPAVAAINLFGLLNKYPHLVSELLIGGVVRDGYKKVSTFTVPRRASRLPVISECANDAYVSTDNVFDFQQMKA